MANSAGRINKLFGTAGSVMLSLYDAFPEDFDPAKTPLMVSIDGLDVPLWCEHFERRGQNLIGFAVEAEEAGSGLRRRGTLTDFYDSDANPLFELEIDGRTALVPAAEEFIAHIDFEGRTVHFILPEGLLDL